MSGRPSVVLMCCVLYYCRLFLCHADLNLPDAPQQLGLMKILIRHFVHRFYKRLKVRDVAFTRSGFETEQHYQIVKHILENACDENACDGHIIFRTLVYTGLPNYPRTHNASTFGLRRS